MQIPIRQLLAPNDLYIPEEFRYREKKNLETGEIELVSREKQYFSYSANFINPGNPIPANGSVTFGVSIQSDSDFVLQALTGVLRTTNNATVIVAPPVTVLITDTGSGRQIFDGAQEWLNLIGTAQEPGVLGTPYFAKAGGTLNFQCNNLDAATAWNARISLLGFKVF